MITHTFRGVPEFCRYLPKRLRRFDWKTYILSHSSPPCLSPALSVSQFLCVPISEVTALVPRFKESLYCFAVYTAERTRQRWPLLLSTHTLQDLQQWVRYSHYRTGSSSFPQLGNCIKYVYSIFAFFLLTAILSSSFSALLKYIF